jgi:hypothetical protein
MVHDEQNFKMLAPCLAAGRSELPDFLSYQLLELWHEFEQVPEVGFQPGVVAMFTTPFWCVAAFTVVLL